MACSCELIIEPNPLDGDVNMARDAAMLQSAVDQKQCSLRFYQWDRPTLSLGYFQRPEIIPTEFSQLPYVRRLSGGGAILHHHELTYACAIPATHDLARNPTGIYQAIHDQIVAVLREFGFNIRTRGRSEKQQDEPFLCFRRQDPHDLIVGSHKVLGSAQRRRKGAVLQHGSLLLSESEFASGLPGLLDWSDLKKCPLVVEPLGHAIASLL
jgi:lipoate-protein ligase A